MWRIMKSKSWRKGDSNFILQSYYAFFFHFSLSFYWVFLAYSDLHHPTLKKLPKLPPKKKEKKESISCFGLISIYRLKQPDFVDTTSIFSDTKQRGYLYPFKSRYGIYRLVWYGIDFLVCDWGHTYEDHSNITFLYYAISKINKYGIWEYLKRVEDVLN